MTSVVPGTEFIGQILAADTHTPCTGAKTCTIRLEIKTFVLRALLERASSVVPVRDVMPVLKNFQFEVAPDRLRVIATDLELSVVSTTEMVTVRTAGTAVFPARKMLDIVREGNDATTVITVDGTNAAITIGRTTWNLRLQGGADYPPMPIFTDTTFARVDRLGFLTALQTVRYACRDACRDNLMMIDVRAGKMTACDGARFQQATFAVLPFDFRIPIGAVDDLIKLLKSSDQSEISIGEAANHLIFAVASDVFVANKLFAQFPDMEAHLLRPALENKHRLVVDRAELLHAIKRVRINADPETSAIMLHLAAGSLTIVARDKYHNDAAETIDADWNSGERVLAVNHAYLTDLLNAADCLAATFWLGTDTKTRKSPLLLKDEPAGTVGVVQQMIIDWLMG